MILLIGEAPNARGASNGLDVVLYRRALGLPGYPGKTRSHWLRAIAELARHDELGMLVRRTRQANILDHYPGRDDRRRAGSLFPWREARGRAQEMEGTAHEVFRHLDHVLLAGTRVARACGARPEYFQPESWAGVPATVVPHPSGANRWWNVPGNRHALLDLLVDLSSRIS